MLDTVSLYIKTEIDIKYAQYECLNIMQGMNLKDLDKIKISTIISELAYNILKYAGHGLIKVSKLEDGWRTGLMIEAIDQGDGIEDLEQVFEDSYSTGGTLGLGLPGIKRMADEIHIDSTPGKGTHVTVKYFSHD